MRGFVSQKFYNKNEQEWEKRNIELAQVVRHGKTFKQHVQYKKKDYVKVNVGWKHFNEKTQKYVFKRKSGGSRTTEITKKVQLKKILRML